LDNPEYLQKNNHPRAPSRHVLRTLISLRALAFADRLYLEIKLAYVE
jgi:hypothetical protein